MASNHEYTIQTTAFAKEPDDVATILCRAIRTAMAARASISMVRSAVDGCDQGVNSNVSVDPPTPPGIAAMANELDYLTKVLSDSVSDVLNMLDARVPANNSIGNANHTADGLYGQAYGNRIL